MLNKAELIARYQELNGGTKKAATEAVESVLGILEQSVAVGEEIAISGYLKGHMHEVAPRSARNPKTGESVDVPAKAKYVLKAGARLTNVVEL